MKNIEKLQNLSAQDFADYINSVFIAGRLYEKEKAKPKDDIDFYQLYNYKEWLNSEE